MNGIGITGYIKNMEQEPNGDFYVDGWKKIICNLSIIGIYGKISDAINGFSKDMEQR